MKLSFIILLTLFCTGIFADEIKIETNPGRPVAGEVFQVYFRIFTSLDEAPVINFTSSNIEVVGKSNQGVSTRTVYANGKLTVTREITIVYDLVSAKPGSASLRDVTVQLGNKTLRHNSVSLNIVKEPEQLAEVFIMADVPKKDLFLGEGIIVRYYLYSKVPVNSLDIKKYPKLNNFLKRFLQEPEKTERVSVDGDIYMRTQIYSAKLYPEKIGELKVDSLQISATYPNSVSNDPFGAFGINRNLRTRTISSEVVKINVRPLPAPSPANFTGLVGQHDFQLQMGQNKLIVNEPLEIKLTVSGVGALENLEAPSLISHPGLEEFETNGDLKISNANQATKVFDYTFLAKENLSVPSKDITLSYFDPNAEKYISVNLNVPQIIVAGGALEKSKEENKKINEVQKSSPETISRPQDYSGIVNVVDTGWQIWLPYLNLSLLLIIFLVALFWVLKIKRFKLSFSTTTVPAVFKGGKFDFSEFVSWIGPLITKTGKSPLTIIKESHLSESAKSYFIDLLSANDYKVYSLHKDKMDFKYNKTYFKELGQYIEREHS